MFFEQATRYFVVGVGTHGARLGVGSEGPAAGWQVAHLESSSCGGDIFRKLSRPETALTVEGCQATPGFAHDPQLGDAKAYPEFQKWLTENPALSVPWIRRGLTICGRSAWFRLLHADGLRLVQSCSCALFVS